MFIEAARQAGWPHTGDFAAETQEVLVYHVTQKRVSAECCACVSGAGAQPLKSARRNRRTRN